MYNSAENLLSRKSDPTAGRQPSPALRARCPHHAVRSNGSTFERFRPARTTRLDTVRHASNPYRALAPPCATEIRSYPTPNFQRTFSVLCGRPNPKRWRIGPKLVTRLRLEKNSLQLPQIGANYRKLVQPGATTCALNSQLPLQRHACTLAHGPRLNHSRFSQCTPVHSSALLNNPFHPWLNSLHKPSQGQASPRKPKHHFYGSKV